MTTHEPKLPMPAGPEASVAPTFVLSPCTPADATALSEIYIAAFSTNPLNKTWLPPSKVAHDNLLAWLNTRFLTSLTRREHVLQKLTDVSCTPSKIVAWQRWTVPHVLSSAEIAARAKADAADGLPGELREWPEGCVVGVAEACFGKLDEAKKRWVVGEEMYVCGLLAVHPDYQGRGLGARLLRGMLERIDSHEDGDAHRDAHKEMMGNGRRCYIEASEAGHGLYARLGWRDVEEIEVDLQPWGGIGVWKNWIMVRKEGG